MRKYNILLVCNAGMSTSLLIEKMKTAAQKKDIECTITAQALEDLESHLEDKDIILLGPQVRFKKEKTKELVSGKIPVEVIDMSAYGTMNGEKVLEQALKLLGNEV